MGAPPAFYIVLFLFYHFGAREARIFGGDSRFRTPGNPGRNKPLMASTQHWKSPLVLPTFRVLHPSGGKSRIACDARPHAARPTRLEMPIMDEILRAKRQQAGSAMRAITIRGAREHN